MYCQLSLIWCLESQLASQFDDCIVWSTQVLPTNSQLQIRWAVPEPNEQE